MIPTSASNLNRKRKDEGHVFRQHLLLCCVGIVIVTQRQTKRNSAEYGVGLEKHFILFYFGFELLGCLVVLVIVKGQTIRDLVTDDLCFFLPETPSLTSRVS